MLEKYLKEDTKPHRKGKYDGTDHMLQATLVGLIALAQYNLYIYGLVATFLLYFGMEIYQEFGMCKRRKCYPLNPFKWSQNRHQDWVFPLIGYTLSYLAIKVILFLASGITSLLL